MSAKEVLLLIGHGSARYSDAGTAMRRHADTLRQEKAFAGVEIGLLNGAPSVADALARSGDAPLIVVPFFMEDGYFTRVAVPQALAGRAATLCQPVGVHDAMAGIIEREALAACAALNIPSRSAAVLVVGHGSASAPGRTLALHRHASRAAATELFARVESACLEEPPFVADMLRHLRNHPVVVIGFFAGEGAHIRDDLPALVQAELAQSGRAVRFHGSVADDPAMRDIILDQAKNGAWGE